MIRFRVDGVLYDVCEIDKKKYHTLNQRLKLLAGLKLNIETISQNGRFTIQNNKDFIDVRASSLPGPQGEYLVFRLLNPRRGAFGLSDLELVLIVLRFLNKQFLLLMEWSYLLDQLVLVKQQLSRLLEKKKFPQGLKSLP